MADYAAKYLDAGATFSPCERHRYRLWRVWDYGADRVAFVGLNPSTATATEDDPTIRRCVAFAKLWGFGGYEMLNLFAWRSTDPLGLLGLEDPVGDGNDAAILEVAGVVSRVVMAWGTHRPLRYILDRRAPIVRRMLRGARELGHLGRCDGGKGHPKHPLYLAAETPFVKETDHA